MTKTQTNPAIIPDIPVALRRTTNAKGVTLSAGFVAAKKDEPKPVVAKPAKATEKPAKKATAPKAAKAAPKDKAAPKPAPAVEATTEEEAAPKVRRSIVPMRFKERYAKHGGTCGDDVASELKAATTYLNEDKRESLDVEALWKIAEANGVDVTKYRDLNNGQKRMNVGNKLRGLLSSGTDVKIGKRVFKAEDFEPRT